MLKVFFTADLLIKNPEVREKIFIADLAGLDYKDSQKFFEIHPNFIYWCNISMNSTATKLLLKYPERICWLNVSYNESIFKLSPNRDLVRFLSTVDKYGKIDHCAFIRNIFETELEETCQEYKGLDGHFPSNELGYVIDKPIPGDLPDGTKVIYIPLSVLYSSLTLRNFINKRLENIFLGPDRNPRDNYKKHKCYDYTPR